MRVTAEAKADTRQRILSTADKLFRDKGFEQTTTRDIARAAGIATGTLFNYFPSKEALAITRFADALEAAEAEAERRRRPGASIEELLFDHIVTGLRHLRPHRTYVRAVLESALSPVTAGGVCPGAEALRTRHVEVALNLILSCTEERTEAPGFVTLHLYWTLYMGVLSFWAGDESPNQADTLAVLDQSMSLFVASLDSVAPIAKEVSSDHEPC